MSRTFTSFTARASLIIILSTLSNSAAFAEVRRAWRGWATSHDILFGQLALTEMQTDASLDEIHRNFHTRYPILTEHGFRKTPPSGSVYRNWHSRMRCMDSMRTFAATSVHNYPPIRQMIPGTPYRLMETYSSCHNDCIGCLIIARESATENAMRG